MTKFSESTLKQIDQLLQFEKDDELDERAEKIVSILNAEAGTKYGSAVLKAYLTGAIKGLGRKELEKDPDSRIKRIRISGQLYIIWMQRQLGKQECEEIAGRIAMLAREVQEKQQKLLECLAANVTVQTDWPPIPPRIPANCHGASGDLVHMTTLYEQAVKYYQDNCTGEG